MTNKQDPVELKEQLLEAVLSARMLTVEDTDAIQLSEEVLRGGLAARILATFLADSDAKITLLSGVDLISDSGRANAIQIQAKAQALSESVEMLLDTVVESMNNDKSNDKGEA